MRRFNNEYGQALLLVMMVLMVLMLIGAAALTRTSGSRMRSFEEKKMVQSSYIAEAGVEKVLAKIKNNYEWLKELEPNNELDYIFAEYGLTSPLDYAGGQIIDLKVTRTSTGDNPTKFYIESKGVYQGATRTIKVTGEMYDPIDFGKGVWINGGLSNFSNNSKYNSDIISKGSLVFDNNVNFNGNIIANDSIFLRNNAKATSILSSKDVWVDNNVEISTSVNAGNDIIIANNGKINGDAVAFRNIDMGENATITGDVYYNGLLDMDTGAIIGGSVTHGGVAPVTVSIPPFPVLEESTYSQYPQPPTLETLSDYPNHYNLSGIFNLDGIFYVPGDLNIQGFYQGNWMIVTKGKVTITGNLSQDDTNLLDDKVPSLAIIALGQDANGVAIDAQNKYSVDALLYTPYKIILDHNSYFYGSLICGQVDVAENGEVYYDNAQQVNQPKWMTTVIKIKSWKESSPVF